MQPVLYVAYKNDKNSKVVFWLCFLSVYYIMLKFWEKNPTYINVLKQ